MHVKTASLETLRLVGLIAKPEMGLMPPRMELAAKQGQHLGSERLRGPTQADPGRSYRAQACRTPKRRSGDDGLIR